QSARKKEQPTEKIIYLETEINAKEKEIGFLKQTLFENDKGIADLKEKLSQLKQTVQTTQSDFVKHMAYRRQRRTLPSSRGALILLSRRIKQKQKSPGANHKRLMASMQSGMASYQLRKLNQIRRPSLSKLKVRRRKLAKTILTINHHGLTLYQKTLDVLKLKMF
ncbi:unnamed protein product, partial [Pocillopora meandrina]